MIATIRVEWDFFVVVGKGLVVFTLLQIRWLIHFRIWNTHSDRQTNITDRWTQSKELPLELVQEF